MADEKDILIELYRDNWEQVRHHETQRSTVSNLILISAAAIIGLVTFDNNLTIHDLPLTFLVLFLGLFGCVFSAKQHERTMWHIRRARQYRKKIEKLLPDTEIRELNEKADKQHREKMPKLFDLRLYMFWIGLHFFVALMGLVLTVLILFPEKIGAIS